MVVEAVENSGVVNVVVPDTSVVRVGPRHGTVTV